MDILCNKPLPYPDLHAFLTEWYDKQPFFLLYEGFNDWDDVPRQTAVFQYQTWQKAEFRYGLSIFLEHDTTFLEKLAYALTQQFNCSAICDASRILLETSSPYYSLLFEQNKVYLVQDFELEETGQVTKIVELTYTQP